MDAPIKGMGYYLRKLIVLDIIGVLKGNQVQLTYVHTVFVSSFCCLVQRRPLKKRWIRNLIVLDFLGVLKGKSGAKEALKKEMCT